VARDLLRSAAPKRYPGPARSPFGLAAAPLASPARKGLCRAAAVAAAPRGARAGPLLTAAVPLVFCFRRPPRMQRMPPRERRRKRMRLATEQLPLPPCSARFTHTRPFPPKTRSDRIQHCLPLAAEQQTVWTPTDYNQLRLTLPMREDSLSHFRLLKKESRQIKSGVKASLYPLFLTFYTTPTC